jgi:hypothetical protein
MIMLRRMHHSKSFYNNNSYLRAYLDLLMREMR